MPSTFDFSNKVAIVTGTASGIGLSTTKLLLASKCRVFGVDLHPPKDEELLTAAADPKSAFHFHQVDISKQDAPREIVTVCTGCFGPQIDVLANVAGILDNFGTAVTIPDDLLNRVLDVNLKAPIRLMGAVLPKMVDQGGGAIVNVSSRAGFSGACSGLACKLDIDASILERK
jgi:NAD(P)-dependent dehydrogenase (short-subunit alcohol dehydrogenase family)